MKQTAIIPILLIVLVTSASANTDTDRTAQQHFEKANELLKQMDYEAAIAEYGKVIDLSSGSKIAQDAQYWIGQSHYKAGRFEAAEETFAKLITEHPTSTIIPATQVMIAQVQQEKENQKFRARHNAASDKGFVIEPKTGVKFTKTKSFVGKRDVIGWDSYLSLSPNGKFLLRHNIVLPLDGGDPFKLVDMDAYSGHWSPDGKKVVFNSGGAVWVIPVSPDTGRTTGPAKKLLDGHYQYSARAEWWSPDGEKLVFMRRDDKVSGEMWTLSIKEGTLAPFTDLPPHLSFPNWSPDGKTIAAYKKDDRSVWLVPSEGGTPKRIMDDVRRFSWSPDSEWLFCTTWRPRKHRFIRIADERVLDITLPEGIGTFFAWSPDGKKLLFYRKPYDYSCILKVVSTSGGPSFQLGRQLDLWPYVHFWSPDSKVIITRGGFPIGRKYKEDLSLWMVPLVGGDALPLEMDETVNGKPFPRSLSPDGKKLLLAVSQGDDKEDLYVAPVSLEEARTTGAAVMVFKRRDKKPVGYGKMDEWAWSPDGSKIAVIHDEDIWITSAEKGRPIRITNTPEHEMWPAWSPDSRMIAYKYYRSKDPNLYIISVSGGEAQEILATPAGRDKYAWSPDGKEIAVVADGAISAISIVDGRAREILDLRHHDFLWDEAWGLSWLPDGRHLAFVSQKITGDTSPTRIFMVPAEGGTVTELAADDDGWKDWLYPSPDGKWISYDCEGEVKTRPGGTIWEADFEEILTKLSE
jgi:Tol biopolymer transport system component